MNRQFHGIKSRSSSLRESLPTELCFEYAHIAGYLNTVELNLSEQYGVGIIPVDINTVDIILVDLNTVEVNPASNIYCRPYSFRPYY